MRAMRAWLVRFGNLFRKERTEREIADEIESNIRLDTAEGIREGLPPEEARRQALIRLGGTEQAKEAWRDRRGIPFLETLARDTVYAFRMMNRSKGWTAVAILSLALGIGANTALFSVVNAVALTHLPVPEPERLVTFRWTGSRGPGGASYGYGYLSPEGGGSTGATFPLAVLEALESATPTLDRVFAFTPTYPDVDGQPDITAQYVSGDYYPGLGIAPLAGRVLTPEDDRLEAPPVVLVSEAYWRRNYGGDRDALGSAITINDTPFTIVGVVPARAGSALRIGKPDYDLSIPLAFEELFTPPPPSSSSRNASVLMLMGRLADGASAEQLEQDLQGEFGRAVREFRRSTGSADPDLDVPRLGVLPGGRGIHDLPPDDIQALALFGGVFALVLAIVCINLATLTLSRAEVRHRELAARIAIGASRWRLVRQLLTESLVIAVCGAAAGLLGAAVVTPVLRPAGVAWDSNVVMFAGALTLVCGLVCGSVPAIRASGAAVARGLKEGASAIIGTRARLGKTLLVGQVALTLSLVVCAGLFLRTIENLRSVPIGFDPSDVWVFSIDQGDEVFAELRDPEVRQRILGTHEEILERLAAAPGVRAATLASQALLEGSSGVSRIFVPGQDANAPESITQLTVHHNFFDAMGIPVRRGRGFEPRDYTSPARVAVANEAFAQTFFPDGSVLGRVFGGDDNPDSATEIVGIVGDTKYASLRDPAPPMLYRAHNRLRRGLVPDRFHVRLPGSPEAAVRTLRAAVRDIDPEATILNPRAHAAMIRDRYAQERVFALVSGLFGGLALTVSMIGLFGLMSYAVARRTKEIGIRMALGAAAGQVLNATLRESLILVAVGVVLGLAGALAVTRFLESMLFGLEPNDPATIGGAIVVMLIVSTLAAYLPARRASRVNPIIALREE